MSSILDVRNYSSWSLSEKLFFFDSKQYELIEDWNEREVILFLKSFILRQDENPYIGQKALSLFVDYALLGKISNRQILNLLIDETNGINGTFFQVKRLKSLLLFYEKEPISIKEIFERHVDDIDVEIKSESLYSLGLLYFLDANKEVNEDEFKRKIRSCITLFRSSSLCTENRIDSLFFLSISEIILGVRSSASYKPDLKAITQYLWNYRLFSLDDKVLIFKVKIYRIIYNLICIIKRNPSNWLQYKDEFSHLCLIFYELKNAEIKDCLIQSSIIGSLKTSVTINTLEPYFRLNFKALRLKIELYLSLPEISKEERDIISYILSLTKNTDTKTDLTDCVYNTIDQLVNNYPNISKQRISDLFNNVNCIEDVQNSTLKAIDLFGKFSFENLHDKLMLSLIKLQGDTSYRDKSENERNTYIRNLLTMSGVNVNDQTLWGSSNQGKAAGEVDIMVLDNTKLPFTIIEALILDSLKQDYLNLHIDKVYQYDTTGLLNNVIIVYSKARKFSDFCVKYIDYVSSYEYPFSMIDVEKVNSGYSEIQICKSILKRNDKITNLYHFIVNMV